MKKNKSNKKKIILISWGLLFTIVMIVLLSMLLFSLQSKSSVKQEPVSKVETKVETNNQQEQETYNAILKKIESEVDKLTLTTEEEIVYQSDGKTIDHIKILDSKTKKEIKRINYYKDGKTLFYIQIFDFKTGRIIKEDAYEDDGKTLEYSMEYNPITGKKIKLTDYNPDGTVKEVKNL